MVNNNDWPEASPLIHSNIPEPYPLDALPPEIMLAVEEVRQYVKAPAALVASSALGVLSTAAQSLVDVERDDSLTGPTSLFLLTLAESGERKTTVDKFFSEVIREHQREETEKGRPLLTQFRADTMSWEAKRDGTADAIRAARKQGKPTDVLEENLRKILGEEPQNPRIPDLLRCDDTPESLAYDLAHLWPAGAVISSEAGIVFGSAGMAKDRVLKNLTFLNVLWDGGEQPIKRRSSDSFTVRGARVTLSLQIQQDALLEFFKQSGQLARGTGFLARFLVAWPESTQGNRFFTKASATWPHLSTFNARLRALLKTQAPLQADGTLLPSMLSLTPEAQEAWIRFHDQIESKLALGEEFSTIKDVASKIADNAVRLAALFHAFTCGTAGAIDVETFAGASRIASWHLHEALRFFGGLSLPSGLADALSLEEWLLAYCQQHGTTMVHRRTLQQRGPSRLRDKAPLDAAFEVLKGHGRVRLIKDGQQLFFEINPALLKRAPSLTK